jgi:hypothetical protein
VEEHQREEPQRLGLVGHQHSEQLGEPDRLVAELTPDEIVASRRRIALVEDEVEDCEHGLEAIREHLVRRNAERDPCLTDLSLRANEALRHRRFGGQEGAGDLPGREPTDLAEGQRYARLRCERRVAAGEDQCEPFVGDRAHLVLLLG